MLKNKGFTLVEITLVIVLIAILIAITTPLVSSVVIRNDLSAAHESLYNALLRAQQLSKTKYKDSQWRVCIDNTTKTYTITAGTCTSTQYPEIITINSGITVSSVQTLDIPFKLINGELDSSNDSIKIDLTGGGVSKSILINKSGVINKEASTEPQSNTTTPSIVTNGLVLHLDAGNINSYPGLNTGQNTWFDLSGNNNHGTLVNGVGYNSDNGGSFVFDGVNDYVTLGTPSLLNQVQVPLTICVWAKANSLGIYNTLWGVYSSINNSRLYSLFRIDSGILRYFTSNSSGGLQYVNSFSISTGVWNFYAVTVSGSISSPSATIYLNNSSQTFSLSALSSTPDATVDFRIGGNQATGPNGELWNGNISNVMWYNRALTTEEIQQNFNATKGRFGL